MSNLPQKASRRTKKKSQDQGYGLYLEKDIILKDTGLRIPLGRRSVCALLETGIQAGEILEGKGSFAATPV